MDGEEGGSVNGSLMESGLWCVYSVRSCVVGT